MNVKEIFDDMTYGPSPEGKDKVEAWLHAHENGFSHYIDGQWVEDYNTNKPKVRQKFDTPFSYLSISLGIKFYFFKKRHDSE